MDFKDIINENNGPLMKWFDEFQKHLKGKRINYNNVNPTDMLELYYDKKSPRDAANIIAKMTKEENENLIDAAVEHLSSSKSFGGWTDINERKLTNKEIKDRDEIADKLPSNEFKKRYSNPNPPAKNWKDVMYATATNIAKESVEYVHGDHKAVNTGKKDRYGFEMYDLYKGKKKISGGHTQRNVEQRMKDISKQTESTELDELKTTTYKSHKRKAEKQETDLFKKGYFELSPEERRKADKRREGINRADELLRRRREGDHRDPPRPGRERIQDEVKEASYGRSPAHWTKHGIHAIIAQRSKTKSGKWDVFVVTGKEKSKNTIIRSFDDQKSAEAYRDKLRKDPSPIASYMKEEHGAGDIGTDELLKRYLKDTPGQTDIDSEETKVDEGSLGYKRALRARKKDPRKEKKMDYRRYEKSKSPDVTQGSNIRAAQLRLQKWKKDQDDQSTVDPLTDEKQYRVKTKSGSTEKVSKSELDAAGGLYDKLMKKKKMAKVKLNPETEIGFEIKDVGKGGRTTVSKRVGMPGKPDINRESVELDEMQPHGMFKGQGETIEKHGTTKDARNKSDYEKEMQKAREKVKKAVDKLAKDGIEIGEEMSPQQEKDIYDLYKKRKKRVAALSGDPKGRELTPGQEKHYKQTSQTVKFMKRTESAELFEDDTDSRELHLYANNHAGLHKQRLTPIRKNLVNKHASGVYDSDKAHKAFTYAAKDAAKHYEKEHGNKFSKETVHKVAGKMRDDFERDHKDGEYNHLLHKKHQQKEERIFESTPQYKSMMSAYRKSDDKKVFDKLKQHGINLGAQGDVYVRNLIKKHKGDHEKAARQIITHHRDSIRDHVEIDESVTSLIGKVARGAGNYTLMTSPAANIAYSIGSSRKRKKKPVDVPADVEEAIADGKPKSKRERKMDVAISKINKAFPRTKDQKWADQRGGFSEYDRIKSAASRLQRGHDPEKMKGERDDVFQRTSDVRAAQKLLRKRKEQNK